MNIKYHGSNRIANALQEVLDESTFNEGQGYKAEISAQHFEIAISLVEQAIANLRISVILDDK